MGHNGIRIYQESIEAYIKSDGKRILQGGNNTFHPGNTVINVGSCEAVGLSCNGAGDSPGVLKVEYSQTALYRMLGEILSVYEGDIEEGEPTRIKIIIETNLDHASELNHRRFYPEIEYKALFPPREKATPLDALTPESIKEFKPVIQGEELRIDSN